MPRSTFKKPRRVKERQPMMFGIPEEAKAPAPPAVSVFDFQDQPVRVVLIEDKPWWVLADVARVLGYGLATDAAKLLRDRDTRMHQTHTSAGPRESLVVSESGIYRLVLRSNKPKAEVFQDWITDEVVPSIMKTGGYSVPSSRVLATQRRLNCTPETAAARVKQVDTNKAEHSRLSAENARPNDYRDMHNGAYRGQFGVTAAGLRGWVDITNGTTPLERMEAIPLTINTHAKILASRYIKEHAVPLADQPAVFERFARQMAEADLMRLGHDFGFGVVDTARRGLVIDVVRRLPSPAA